MKRPALSAIYTIFFATLGCEGDPVTDPGERSPADTASMQATPNDPEPDPVFAICGVVFTTDSPTSYLALVPSLDASTTIDLTDTVPFGGAITCGGLEPDGAVFVGSGEAPTIQRWEAGPDGRPVLDEEVNFAGLGLTSTFRSRNAIQLVDERKGYFFSNDLVVVFDPTAMTIIDSFVLDGLFEDGIIPALSFPIRVGDRFVLPAWRRRPDGSLEPWMKLAFVDVNTDAVTYGPTDTRCSVDYPVVADNGDIYMASAPDQGLLVDNGLAGDPASPPCILRIASGATEFDPNFLLHPSDTIPPQFAGGLLQGRKGTTFTIGLDDALAPPIDEQNATTALQLPAWRYYGIQLPEPSDAPGAVKSLPPASGVPWVNVADGVTYVPLVDFVAGTTQLYDLSDPTEAVPAVQIPGFPLQAFRIR